MRKILFSAISTRNVSPPFVPLITFVDAVGDGDPTFLADDATDDYELPASENGDLLLFVGTLNFNITPAIQVNTAGWTSITALNDFGLGGQARSQDVWYKFSDGTDSVIQVQNVSGATKWLSGTVSIWRGVQQEGDGGPFDVTPISGHIVDILDVGSPVTNPPITPAITTITDEAVFITSWCAGRNYTKNDPPSGYTNRIAHISSTLASQTLASKLIPSAGLETPGAWDLAIPPDNDIIGFSMVLKPAQTPI